jgi:anhydro-N-acetylmuramic acid kinase
MVMDALTARLTAGRQRFDEGGRLAAQGTVNEELLRFLLDDPYLAKEPPKTTGREAYGQPYVERLIAKGNELGVSLTDQLATVTRFTPECVRVGMERFCPQRPERLILAGGGSRNETLLRYFRQVLPVPVQTQEELGLDSDAKEAVAFAILANECLHGICNNVPGATGARHPVVMGKVSL